jgi:ketosteroid isomerase-like protein
MSQENVDLVQRFAQAFNASDLDALCDVITPDFEFAPYLATLIEATVYRGQDGLRTYFADASAAWETIRVRLDEILDRGDHIFIAGELYGKGRSSGLEVTVPVAWIGEARDGKVVRLTSYGSRNAALKAVGLAE